MPAAEGGGNLFYSAEKNRFGKDLVQYLGCHAESWLCQEHLLGEDKWNLNLWTTSRLLIWIWEELSPCIGHAWSSRTLLQRSDGEVAPAANTEQ